MSPHRGQLRTGGSRDGLFDFAPGAEYVTAAEVTDNRRTAPCDWCNALPGEDCTRPIRGGRRVAITGYHDGRGRRTEDHDGPPPAVQAALARLREDPDHG